MLIQKNSVKSQYQKLYSLNGKKIGIPIFQRFFAWKSSQIVQLKEDLLAAADDRNAQLYFLDFIYYKEDGMIKIADGQQRLMTINNLIKAIQDVAQEKAIKIDPIKLFDISYDIKANNDKYTTHMTKYVTSPFKTIYMDLKNYVEKNITKINDFIRVIKEQIYIYMKECSTPDDAFLIFQQINTGGKPLSKDDVIKTALDQYSKIYNINLDTSNTKEIRQSIISYYKIKTNNLNKNFDNMEIITFLRDYVTKNKTTYEDFANSLQIMKKVKDSAMAYIINYINRTTLMDVVNILAVKNIDLNTDREYLEKVMIPLCMMSVTLSFNGASPTIFRYLLNDVVEKIKSGDTAVNIQTYLLKVINNDPTVWKISQSEFVDKLGNSSTPRNVKKALLICDVIVRNTSGTVNVASINLEHIYPKNPDIEWASQGWPTHSDQQKELIDNIGNYMLLNEEVNKSIQNKYITHKINAYNQIIPKDLMLQTKMNTVDFDKFEVDRDNYIKARQADIGDLIKNNFPFGRVLII